MTAMPSGHLDRADQLLDVASVLLQSRYWSDSVSRSYYAVFHAAKAVLMETGIERNSHHAVWSAFGEHIAARGRMDRRLHRLALDLFEARVASDYLPIVGDTEQDASEHLTFAREFVAAACAFVEDHT